MTKPLTGTLVLSLDQAVAAPMTSRRLADAGARVIKLERPEGDFARHYDSLVHGECTHFAWLNRGKESVVADLAKPDDKRLFEAILAKADVLLQNLKPGALAKLGYATESLRKRHPRLICCSISGYGDDGPFRDRKAYDLLMQAESGLASVTGGPEAPARVGVSIVDICTGMNAYEAILEALIARGRTGQGADIRVSMFDSMMEWMAVPMLSTEYGAPPKRIGLSHTSLAPYGVFQTADDVPILISIQNDREWVVFCAKVLGSPSSAATRALPTTRRASPTGPRRTRSRNAASAPTTSPRCRACWKRPRSPSPASTISRPSCATPTCGGSPSTPPAAPSRCPPRRPDGWASRTPPSAPSPRSASTPPRSAASSWAEPPAV